MKNITRVATAGLVSLAAVFALTACEGDESTGSSEEYKDQQSSVSEGRDDLYRPKNSVEYNNYNKAQEIYDDPNAIQWCTTAWTNDSAPLFTVPIAGKLTSSSVSYFPNEEVLIDNSTGGRTHNPELRSIDGMYHGNPPAYRFGFTPAGQYVDFSGMEVFCTTALTKFQKEETSISFEVDGGADDAQTRAQELLSEGKGAEAQELLSNSTGQ